MGLKIGISGAGQFASSFIPLFQVHPAVDEVCIAEVFPERRAKMAELFRIRRAFASHEELLRSDVDAVVILTQRWTHADLAVQALRAGKHVWSAVPAGITLEEIGLLVDTVKATGLTYMLAETSYYYPATLYCRERFANGDFGRFVYGEAEYIHDMSHGFYDAYKYSGGDGWKATASFPPMLYPSHSVSMIASVTGARMTHVSCLGYEDTEDDGVFRADVSLWGNTFSNQTALFRTSDGGMARLNEFRRVGWADTPSCASVRMSLFGTEASYEEQNGGKVWTTRQPPEATNVTDLLICPPATPSKTARQIIPAALTRDFYTGTTPAHPTHRLPPEFVGMPNGHEGAHQFLVLDFIEAITSGKLPPNHVWAAARYCVPGIVAHESARRGGEQLPIPDFGWPSG
jgi:predicted dehydrogenase